MKIIDTWTAIQMAVGEQDRIGLRDFNVWCEDYLRKNPDVYIENTRNDLWNENHAMRIYLETNDFQIEVIHIQDSIRCPICGNPIYKHPFVDKFEELKTKIDKWNSK